MYETITPFQQNLALLDEYLTEGHPKTVEQVARTQAFTPEKFMQTAYYLSDGGYSRIALNDSTLKLFLTSNSLDKPRKNWPDTQELRELIEADILEAYTNV